LSNNPPPSIHFNHCITSYPSSQSNKLKLPQIAILCKKARTRNKETITTPADVIYREETHLNMNEWKIFTIDTPGHHPWCRRHSLQTMANNFKRMRCFFSERQTNVHRCASHALTWVCVLLGPTVLHLCMRWCASWLMGQGRSRHRRTVSWISWFTKKEKMSSLMGHDNNIQRAHDDIPATLGYWTFFCTKCIKKNEESMAGVVTGPNRRGLLMLKCHYYTRSTCVLFCFPRWWMSLYLMGRYLTSSKIFFTHKRLCYSSFYPCLHAQSIYEWNDFKPLCARGKLESSTYLFEGPGSGFPCVLVLSVIRHSKTSHRNGSGKNPLGAWCLSL